MFLVFAYNIDRSRGGWWDLQFTSNHISDVQRKIKFDKAKEKFIIEDREFDRFQVVNVNTLEEIDTSRWSYTEV